MIFKFKREINHIQAKNAASNDDLRPVMQGVLVDTSCDVVAITNAHIMVLYPIEIIDKSSEFNCSIPLSILNIKGISYHTHLTDFVFRIDITNGFAYVYEPNADYLDNTAFLLRQRIIEGKTPKFLEVFPKEKSQISDIGINLNTLIKLQRAIKTKGSVCNFKIEFFAKNKPVVFTEIDNDDPIKGLIMPVMLSQ